MKIALSALKYPPDEGGADEGWTREYDNGFAWRRALRPSVPTLAMDLDDGPGVPEHDFPYGDYYFCYDAAHGADDSPLVIWRLLHYRDMLGEL